MAKGLVILMWHLYGLLENEKHVSNSKPLLNQLVLGNRSITIEGKKIKLFPHSGFRARNCPLTSLNDIKL